MSRILYTGGRSASVHAPLPRADTPRPGTPGADSIGTRHTPPQSRHPHPLDLALPRRRHSPGEGTPPGPGTRGVPQCMLRYHPPEQTSPDQVTPPPKADPQDQAPPGPDTPQTRQPSTQTRHPPCPVHAGRYDQQAGGMHPTGMQSALSLSVELLLCINEHSFVKEFR